jgi:TonB family protein
MAPLLAGLSSGRALRPGTIVSILIHGLVVAGLLAPVGQAIEASFFDRHLVYLVPPNRSPEPHVELPSTISAPPRIGTPGAGVDDPTGGPLDAPASQAGEASSSHRPRLEDLVPARTVRTETALTEVEVDSAVIRDPTSAAPEYPPRMLAAGITGQVTARYVVDTLGTVDTLTFTVVEFTHREFSDAVRRALPGMHFRPAIQRGKLVRQWVEQTFHFRIQPPSP